ncbi:hypothetical protein [Pseudomonas izuensis]|uniref:hypothetical protein n=1 Tax=Pseudomonas izuensis TaxID=2684212 RepID=UPI00135AD3E6|nr:hypothetical protein [Pseudomonas izuensis]
MDEIFVVQKRPLFKVDGQVDRDSANNASADFYYRIINTITGVFVGEKYLVREEAEAVCESLNLMGRDHLPDNDPLRFSRR